MSFADVLLRGRTYRTPLLRSLYTLSEKRVFAYRQAPNACSQSACVWYATRGCSLRTRGRRPHDDVDVDYASVSMVTVDVGPGPYAFNPTSTMMCGGSRGVAEEGAGRRRIKSSKSFYLSTPALPAASSSLPFPAFLLYLFCPNHEPLRVAFSRSLSSLDRKILIT